jgi:hypothetical protein
MGPLPPSQGFVDSASTYEIVTACDLGSPKKIYPWAWTVANDLTMGLVFLDHIRLAPSPGPAGQASELYAVLTDALLDSNVLGVESVPDERTRTRSLNAVRKRLALPAETEGLRQRIADLDADDTNYKPWLDWIVTSKAWIENSNRLGTLVNREFSSEIATVLNVSVMEVNRVAMLSGDPTKLETVMSRPGGDTFALLAKAFLTSALIRGKYHELVIGKRAQFIRHPMRARPASSSDYFPASKMQAYFSSAILAGALSERTSKARIKTWVRLVLEARKARRKAEVSGLSYLNDVMPGGAPVSDDDARQRAVDLAVQLGVADSLGGFYRTLDVALQIGVAGTGFVLSPPVAAAIAVGWWALNPVVKLGKIRRQHVVTEMAKFGPGIVDQASIESRSTSAR